jgi:hypothetical protein
VALTAYSNVSVITRIDGLHGLRGLTESTAPLFVILSEFFLLRPHHPLSLLACFPYGPAFVAAFVLSTPDYLYHTFPSPTHHP